jgi:nucleoside-diphosphate-sugar epimerase
MGCRLNTNPSLFEVADISRVLAKSHLADIRDLDKLREAMALASPEVVIHMAAQPLVRYSYANPVETYATNVMGTVHVLECIQEYAIRSRGSDGDNRQVLRKQRMALGVSGK